MPLAAAQNNSSMQQQPMSMKISTVKKLGVAYEDEKMGKLTMNAGLFAFKANQAGTQADNFIALNFRYPKGVTAEGLEIGVERTVGMEGATVTPQ